MYDALRSERNAFADSSLTDNYRKGEDALVEALILSCANFLVKPVRIGPRLGRPTPPPSAHLAPPPTTIRRPPSPNSPSTSARRSTSTPSSCSTKSGGRIPTPRFAPASAAPATPPAAPSAARRSCSPTCERRRARPACRSRRSCERVTKRARLGLQGGAGAGPPRTAACWRVRTGSPEGSVYIRYHSLLATYSNTSRSSSSAARVAPIKC